MQVGKCTLVWLGSRLPWNSFRRDVQYIPFGCILYVRVMYT